MSKEFQIRDGNLIASFDLGNEDGDIDFCKLLKVSHGVADEIGMFVDYVATNKIIKDQSKQIADLEAKLAESEKERELDNSFWKQECDSLQKTLAEKDKEIESLKHVKVTIGTMETNQVDISSTTYTDQDKISFALEQLEQLKKLCQEKFNWWENSEWEGDIYDKADVSNAYFDIEANIDNQIKSLKGREVV